MPASLSSLGLVTLVHVGSPFPRLFQWHEAASILSRIFLDLKIRKALDTVPELKTYKSKITIIDKVKYTKVKLE